MTNAPQDPPGNAAEERDAYLRSALRHAPDADVAPPAALSEAILREARGAAAQAQPRRGTGAANRASPGRPGGWRAILDAWAWLARPRVAAGFASLMVATLAGVIWWGQPMERLLDRPQPDSAPANSAMPAPVLMEELRATPGAARPHAPAAQAGPQATAKAAQQAQPGRTSTQAQAEEAKRERARPSTPDNAQPRLEERARAQAQAKSALQAAAPPAVAPQAAAPTTAAPPAEATPAPAPPTAALPTDSLSTDSLPTDSLPTDARLTSSPSALGKVAAATPAPPARDAALGADTVRRSAESTAAPKPVSQPGQAPREPKATGGARPALQQQPAASGLNSLSDHRGLGAARASAAGAAGSLAELHTQLLMQPERWRWQVGGAEPRAVTPALQVWLRRVDGSAASSRVMARAAGPAIVGVSVELLRDGVPRGLLLLGPDALQWASHDAPLQGWTARLTATEASQLKTELDDMLR